MTKLNKHMQAIKDYSEGGTKQVCLSGISATTLEGIVFGID